VQRCKEELRGASNLSVMVQVTYLKTYCNAGRMEVLVGGRSAGVLDTLYADFVRFKYSINELHTFTVTGFDEVPSALEIRWLYAPPDPALPYSDGRGASKCPEAKEITAKKFSPSQCMVSAIAITLLGVTITARGLSAGA
jgi:hypothetical protein